MSRVHASIYASEIYPIELVKEHFSSKALF